MRDGNGGSVGFTSSSIVVFELPMRDGNIDPLWKDSNFAESF